MFNDLEKLALTCLDDNFNLEKFNQGIDKLVLPSVNTNDISLQRTSFQASHPAWRHALSSLETLPDLMPGMLDSLLRDQCFAYSVWWTQGSEMVAPSLLICVGLPPFDGFAAMFDGKWQRWGWEGNRYSPHF